MRLRSLLFVPGDSEHKFAKASGIGADALILDLEDAVAPPRKALAREMVKGLLNGPVGFRTYHCRENIPNVFTNKIFGIVVAHQL